MLLWQGSWEGVSGIGALGHSLGRRTSLSSHSPASVAAPSSCRLTALPASLQMTPPGPLGRGAAGSWFSGFLPCRWRLCLFLLPPPPPNSLQSAACGYSFHLGDFGRGGSLGEGAPGSCRDLGAGHSETKQGSQFRPGLRTKAGEGCGVKNSFKCLRCPTDPHQLSQGSDGTEKAGLLPW